MRSQFGLIAAAALIAALPIRADVTIRYKMETQAAAEIPPALTQDTFVRLKGTRSISNMGTITVLLDIAKREITLIDPARKVYATVPASEYQKLVLKVSTSAAAAAGGVSFDPTALMGAVKAPPPPAGFTVEPAPGDKPAVPAVAGSAGDITSAGGVAGFEGLKPKTETRKTGRTATIQGIETEETEITISMAMPGVGEMKMVARTWSPAPKEYLRVQALRELNGLSFWWEQIAGTPGLGPEFSADALRFEMDMKLPASLMPSDQQPVPVMKMEVMEFSSAPLDASLFEIPAGFHAAEPEPIVKAAMQALIDQPEQPATDTGDAKAYIFGLTPLKQTEPVYPEAARAKKVQGEVEVLVTISPTGDVANVEALSGPELLRPAALAAVKQWKFRPVIRDGAPVAALTSTDVMVMDPDHPAWDLKFDAAETMAVQRRLSAIEAKFPRTPQQVLGDLEDQAQGREAPIRFTMLDQLSEAALAAGMEDKAAKYANEVLTVTKVDKLEFWMDTHAIHDAHTTLGLIALRHDDRAGARQHLLDSARVATSPVLASFGPSMRLAKELLDKGDTSVVLDYFSLCRTFWKSGTAQLDQWSADVSNGRTPQWGFSLR